MSAKWKETVICEECQLTLDKVEYIKGQPLSLYYNGIQYCRDCHPYWPKAHDLSTRLAHLHTYKSGRKASLARISEIRDRVKSKDDNKTVINRSTGKETQGWVGK